MSLGIHAIDRAREFLAPVLEPEQLSKAQSASILERLSGNLGSNPYSDQEIRHQVLLIALDLLEEIWHAAKNLALSDPSSSTSNDLLLRDSVARRTVDGLLDLISLEGIYPQLRSGVGVPIERRVRSILKGTESSANVVARNFDTSFLVNIAQKLHKVAVQEGNEVSNALRERTLVDVVAAEAQLAFDPDVKIDWNKNRLDELVGLTPTPLLLPLFTSLLHPTTPAWLKPHITLYLSLLPLREHGVRETIFFLANSAPQSQTLASSGPTFSLEVLKHAARLLSSTPSSMSTDLWIVGISNQLLELLDDEDEYLKSAGAYIIGTGILNRKQLGAPGSVGWRHLAQPVLDRIRPPTEHAEEPISMEKLPAALRRLHALCLLHPNPGLLKRLVSPLLLSLWAILCISRDGSEARSLSLPILKAYITLSASDSALMHIVENIAYLGPHGWAYSMDKIGTLTIQKTDPVRQDHVSLLELVGVLEDRLVRFCILLDEVNDTNLISEILLIVLNRCFHTNTQSDEKTPARLESDKDDSMQRLKYAKLAHKMLEKYSDLMATRPERLLDLIYQVLSNSSSKSSVIGQITTTQKLAYSDLSSIVKHQDAVHQSGASNTTEDEVSLSLSLLHATIAAPNMTLTTSVMDTLSKLQVLLPKLDLNDEEQRTTRMELATRIALVKAMHNPEQNQRDPATDIHALDRDFYAQALKDIASELIPVRGEALATITRLISKVSPVLDIPATAVILISLLQDDDEFIYLAAVKALTTLASRHTKTTISILLDHYIDASEAHTLDVRLRLGEALQAIIQSSRGIIPSQTAQPLAQALITIAGKRATRPKTGLERGKAQALEMKRIEEAARQWGGEVPDFGDDEPVDAASERLAKMLAGWEGRPGEEDLRMRTSALSLLGLLIETAPVVLGSGLISTAVDLAVSVLKFEAGMENAIVRRAAVLIFDGLLEALGGASERGERLGFGLEGKGLEDVLEVLRWKMASDGDEVVRGHVGKVIGKLEAWRERSLMEGVRQMNGNVSFKLEGPLRGLEVYPEAKGDLGRPKIEEIE